MASSFLSHTLAAAGGLIVQDAAADERFRAHPWVGGEPGVRFYAGCAIMAPDGAPWGTVAVLDGRPRRCDADEGTLLLDLAGLIEDELQREAAAAAVAVTERRLRLLLAYGPGMIYSLDSERFGLTFLSENVAQMLGYEASAFGAPEFWLSHVHPEDLPGVDAAFAALQVAGRSTYEYRFLHADGSYRWMLDEMNLVPGSAGGPGEVFGVWLDRTAQHRIEDELREAGEKERRILDASSAMIFALRVCGEQIVPVWSSDNLEPILGYSRDERHDPSWWAAHVHPEDKAMADAAFASVVEHGSGSVEFRFPHKAGPYRWIRQDAKVVSRDAAGVDVVGSWWDITAWKAAEEARQTAEIGFRAVFESALEAILVLDDDGRFLEMNPAAQRWLGAQAGDLLGRSHPELAEEPDELVGWWEKLRREGRARGEMHFRRPDGVVRTAEFYAVADYLPGRHLAVLRDVTERTEARLAEARLARILDFTPNVVAMMQLDQTLVYLNRSARLLLGVLADDDVSGLRLVDFPLARQTREALETGFRAALESGLWSGESVLVASGGEEIPYLFQVVAHPGARPEERLLSLIGRDIVELKRSERELREAKEEAERANRAKTEFLSQISHELRTPLSSILGFAEMLIDDAYGELSERQKQFLDNVLLSSRHLLSLINDLLDLVKVEAGRIDLQLVGAELGSLIADIVQAVRAQADQAGLALTVEALEPFPAVAVDLRRFKQILLNLLSNAIKFTPRGGTIRVAPETRAAIRPQGEAERAGPWLCIRVIDNGIGISAEDQKRLFQPFVQIVHPQRGFQPGTGLGLVLSRRLAEQHGGSLWVESEGEGKGSTFTLALLLRPPGGAPA